MNRRRRIGTPSGDIRRSRGMPSFALSLIVLIGFTLVSVLSVPSRSMATVDEQAGRRPPRRERPQAPSVEKPAEDAQKPTSSTPQSGEEQKPSPQPQKEAQAEGEPIRLKADLVSVPVVVFDKKTGRVYTGLKRGNFTVLEDGVKQEIVTFSGEESPITLVMLLEYSRQIEWFREEVINPAGLFVTRFVKPGDYIAIVAFDIRPAVLTDFTDSPARLREAIYLLIRNYPAFSESNLFDALNFVLRGGELDGAEYTGLQEIEGRTAVLLVAIGIDTFSKINYDEARRIVENAGVPIYAIGIGELAYILLEHRLPPESRLTFLQAQNTLKTFAEVTGGRFYSVRFQGALPSVLESISVMLRTQYTLGYTPTNPRREGKRRRIQVLVDVDGDGKPDNDRLEVQHRRSYIEPREGKK
ncbi:MAG: VWA domain-containing protein [Blastocatellia bacterium]|nr:VWA domain-containing protein [Blastocatellia bacterium]MCS7156201.1 VWA domain-containing protein [Blastocatellia bacterium]MCX7751449.1 VWA domain-containing protein [Blastocatellia bacterium]MDW8169162.1 VWA domain-containing protein [Acidobacteriota bacterium]MDW8256023.1 VWA domain-containing protein [Acidobacteriota bacterium]